MNKFVNRNKELEALEVEYKRKTSSMFILYGRRRVGKTALIRQFIKEKTAVYFLATEENERQNMTAFKDIVASYTENELLAKSQVSEWRIIFETLIKYPTKGKKVIIIDEFQYLGKVNPAFPSIIQKVWDTLLKDSNVMLILCGSFISMMESQTLSYNSPLYGRRTGQIRLKPIQYKYYNEFFPEKYGRDLVEYFAVTGGVPKYIELFNDYDDIYDAIEHNILSPSSFLYDEPNFLLQREVAQVGTYFSIIKSIAAGNHKVSRIASDLEFKATGLSKYLEILINLDILERQVPVTEKNPAKSKKGLYQIKDYFLLFWFKFIYPNLSYIESGNIDYVMNRIKTNFVDGHVAYVYEDLCLESMWQLNADGIWPFHFDHAGRFWDKNTEIDIVALDNDKGNIIFGECKYWKKPVGINILDNLKAKSGNVKWKTGDRKEHFVLFSMSGFTSELEKLAKEDTSLTLFSEVLNAD